MSSPIEDIVFSHQILFLLGKYMEIEDRLYLCLSLLLRLGGVT